MLLPGPIEQVAVTAARLTWVLENAAVELKVSDYIDQTTMAVFMFAATRHATIRWENASTMKQTYAIPDRVGT